MPNKIHSIILICLVVSILGYFIVPKITGHSTFNYVPKTVIRSCIDSDSYNIYQNGYVKYGNSYYKDSCLENGVETYKGFYVVENYCKDDAQYSVVKYCSKSCINGKCL